MNDKALEMDRAANYCKHEVWKMFDEISPTYDILNHLLSFGADIYWRKKLIEHIPQQDDVRLLDLATGTGDQLLTILRKAPQVKTALGLDMSQEMIRLGQKKIIDKPFTHQVSFMEGDATNISLMDDSVDCITMSFGIRNVTDTSKCLAECLRVLAPCGKLLILEFSLPRNRYIRKLHLLYLRHILPRIASWISSKKDAYRYLNQTVEDFPYGETFCEKLRDAGFYYVKFYPLTFGVATLYIGEKLPCATEF